MKNANEEIIKRLNRQIRDTRTSIKLEKAILATITSMLEDSDDPIIVRRERVVKRNLEKLYEELDNYMFKRKALL